MSYLIGGSQILVGIAILVTWWLTLALMGRRNRGKPMTTIGFAIVPSLFLLWLTAGGILIVRGLAGM